MARGSSKNYFSHDQRQTAMRRIACSFPKGREGIKINSESDAEVQLIDYLASRVHLIGEMNAKKFRELLVVVIARLIDEGYIYMNRRGDAWRVAEKFRRTQQGTARNISASSKERARFRHAVRGAYAPS